MGITSLNPGQTLSRVHFGVRFQGVTSNEQNFQALAEDFLAVGLVTISSVTGSTPPNALTGRADANPPLERWLWWGTATMRPDVMGSEHPDVMAWSTGLEIENLQSKGQVKANVPAGQLLHVFVTWAPWTTAGWQVRGNVTGNAWASALVQV
jgi:hypothetical protein